MELKISDLPPQFENIAIELGIDKEATHLINIGMCSFLNFIY